ncbi:MAG: hypothetical protein GY866_16305 [Proteobacteria bacterium]|nr:hypothetical protein [Pseudomonadota bacterium]
MIDISELREAVQSNCDRVDAESAQNYGLCVYLIKMREYYRWRKGLSFDSEIRNHEIIPWIADLETSWERMEGEAFGKIVVDRKEFDPFETESINSLLTPEGLVYSGGFGYAGIPLFFLARLERKMELDGFSILISSEELSRGMYGSPAMLQNRTIFIRKEALKYLLWARYDEWLFSKLKNTMYRAFSYYDLETDPDSALEEMANNELNTLILHEMGEGRLEERFGEKWREMLIDFAHTKTEIIARAVRDLAADCLSTLPSLVRENREASIHFYFANFSDMRKALFPDLLEAYKDWKDTSEPSRLLEFIEKGKVRWLEVGDEILRLYRSKGTSADKEINELIGQ